MFVRPDHVAAALLLGGATLLAQPPRAARPSEDRPGERDAADAALDRLLGPDDRPGRDDGDRDRSRRGGDDRPDAVLALLRAVAAGDVSPEAARRRLESLPTRAARPPRAEPDDRARDLARRLEDVERGVRHRVEDLERGLADRFRDLDRRFEDHAREADRRIEELERVMNVRAEELERELDRRTEEFERALGERDGEAGANCGGELEALAEELEAAEAELAESLRELRGEADGPDDFENE